MSYTTVYELYKTKVNSIKELKNSHGSMPAICEYVSLKLYKQSFKSYEAEKNGFWGSYRSKELTINERMVLLSTYDLAYIPTEYLYEYAEACEEVHKSILEYTTFGWSHFKDIGEIAKNLSGRHDPRLKGLCIGCTSVSDPWEFADVSKTPVWPVFV